MSTGSHLGAHFKALQKGRLSTGSLPGVGCVGLGDDCAIARIFITLQFYQCSRMYRYMGWVRVYAEWMKLLFTMWVTFHLFCFAVLHKNLQKLEVMYVVTSLLVPAVIACIPLITHSYGRTPDGTECFIYAFNDIAQLN